MPSYHTSVPVMLFFKCYVSDVQIVVQTNLRNLFIFIIFGLENTVCLEEKNGTF